MVGCAVAFLAVALADVDFQGAGVGSTEPELEAFMANETRLCQMEHARAAVAAVPMSRRMLWRRADTIAAGYPSHLQQYVRLLGLSLTGSLDLSPKYLMEAARRFCGLDWPSERGFTMVGLVRLRNIAQLLLSVVSEKIPGDYAEVGVWRGGTGILARGILNELERHGSRTVHLFDAFDVKVSKYESGHRDLFAQTRPRDVIEYFKMFGVDNKGLQIHRGLFNQSLPQFYAMLNNADLKIAVLRIDGNWYDAHQDALYYLYSFVPVGGYVIFDDFAFPWVQSAWSDFTSDQRFTEEVVLLDANGGYFRKTKEVQVNFRTMREPRDCNL